MICRCGHKREAHRFDENRALNDYGDPWLDCVATVVAIGYTYPCSCWQYESTPATPTTVEDGR